jgi:triphosphoribosyl-dephospho-CoA synthase
VLARIIPNGSLEQIIYRVDALHWLEDQGVVVMNSPRCIERSVDKFYTSSILQGAGLATPETVVCERADDAMDAFRGMGDVIVKPLFGSMGLGMVRVSDEDSAWRVFRALEAIRGIYYLQRAVRQRVSGEEGDARAEHAPAGRDVRAARSPAGHAGLGDADDAHVAGDIASAAQLACLLEASAPKPGNVSPGRHFHDTRYEDFLASTAAIGPAFVRAGGATLGSTILESIRATARWTRSNTNLGIVLLLAPLAHAAHGACRTGTGTIGARIRAELARILRSATVRDAADVYQAIRIARPAGLGSVESEDVAAAPSVALRDAMALAADRDGIAREYATDFATTFETGAPALARARSDGLSWDDAVLECYLELLAAAPDTHIARKLGSAVAVHVSEGARDALGAGGVRTSAGRDSIALLDRQLRDERNARNPGTTADLTAAAIYVVLLEERLQPNNDGIR